MLRNRGVQSGMGRNWNDVSSHRLRGCDYINNQAYFVALNFRERFRVAHRAVATVYTKSQSVLVGSQFQTVFNFPLYHSANVGKKRVQLAQDERIPDASDHD